MWATVFGGLVGGVVATKFGFLRSVFWTLLLHGLSNVMYVVIAHVGYDMKYLYTAIALEHVTGGMRTSVFYAYQLTLCNVSFAATQIALLTSAESLGRSIFSPMSGWLVEVLGWIDFFTISVFATTPACCWLEI